MSIKTTVKSTRKPRNKFTAKYFIKKFSAIPRSKWCEHKFEDTTTGACCVMGHLGMRGYMKNSRTSGFSPEVAGLCKLLGGSYSNVVAINNQGSGKSPKTRILAALRKLVK